MEKPKANFSTLLKVILGIFVFILIVVLIAGRLLKIAESKVKSQDGRVNILILGKGGEGHAGGDLTDTIILASISLTEQTANLISIPRDIWISEIRAKLNSAYYWGKEKPEFGGGLNFAKKNVEMVVGIPINYALVLDFSSFKDIVDALGGVNIVVSNSFTDSLYPIEGRENDTCDGDKEFKCRYETVHFEKGETYMDGTTALKYVRSRNGDNGENTDIAREERQQKVISAIKNKILSKKTLVNPFKLIKIWNVVSSYVETDIDLISMIVLGIKIIEIDGNMVTSIVPDGILVSPPKSQRYDYQYVFVPKDGSWSQLQNWIKETISKN